MTAAWFPRPVLFVSDAEASYRHYIDVLGFTHAWRHEHEGALLVCEVERDGVQLILNRDAERAGKGRVFINPNDGESFRVSEEMRSRGADVTRGHWGMPVMRVRDPDGNELYFSDDGLTDSAE